MWLFRPPNAVKFFDKVTSFWQKFDSHFKIEEHPLLKAISKYSLLENPQEEVQAP